MNSRPWPVSDQITPVNTNAQTAGQLQQALATLNALITQFNALVATEGNLKLQIENILKQLGRLFPYDGIRDPGYISNTVQKNWPNDNWIVGNGSDTLLEVAVGNSLANSAIYALAGPVGGGVYFDTDKNAGIAETATGNLVLGAGADDVLTFIPGTPGTTSFAVNAGPVTVLGGAVYLDTDGNAGISEVAGALVLGAGGNDVLTFTPGGSATTVFATAAGPVQVLSGQVTIDAGNAYGMKITSGNLELGIGSGTIQVKTHTGETTDAEGSSTGGLTFYKGLYVGGNFTSSGGGGTDPSVDPTLFWLRYNDTGPLTDGASWYLLDTFLPDITAGNPWPGSTALVTVGTVATGRWEGDQIAQAYIADSAISLVKMDDLAANRIIGNNTGSAATPLALTAAEVKTLLSLDTLTNDKQVKGLSSGTTAGHLVTWGANGYTVADGGAALDLSGYVTTTYLEANYHDNDEITSILTSALSSYATTAAVNSLLDDFTGSENITTLGAVTTCTSLHTQGDLETDGWLIGNVNVGGWNGRLLFAPAIDGPRAIWFGSKNIPKIAMYFDTVNGIGYPNRLVLPGGA